MNNRPNILVVCGRNKRRSRTAEYIYKNDMRFSIRSVGLSPRSERKITVKDIEWAQLIFVMESKQNSRIKELYRHCNLPPIETLYIEDEYDYLDPDLMVLLEEKINSTLWSRFQI